MNKMPGRSGTTALLAATAFLAFTAQAHADLRCTMHFTLKGWSAFYKTASGHGKVSCSDGSAIEVKLSSKGGGLTLGTSSIDDGIGEFSGVDNIRDILGTYATGSAHGAAGDAGVVQALTKGEVSLALKGTGHGLDAGVDFGKFVISEVTHPAPPPEPPVTTEAPPAPAQ
jgi:hypothetical protein